MVEERVQWEKAPWLGSGAEQELRPDGPCTSEVADLHARPVHEHGRRASAASSAASAANPVETKALVRTIMNLRGYHGSICFMPVPGYEAYSELVKQVESSIVERLQWNGGSQDIPLHLPLVILQLKEHFILMAQQSKLKLRSSSLVRLPMRFIKVLNVNRSKKTRLLNVNSVHAADRAWHH